MKCLEFILDDVWLKKLVIFILEKRLNGDRMVIFKHLKGPSQGKRIKLVLFGLRVQNEKQNVEFTK